MRKFMLIEEWLGENNERCVRKTIDTYDNIMKRVSDEHYREGICMAFAIIAADDDGEFGNTIKFEEAILN